MNDTKTKKKTIASSSESKKPERRLNLPTRWEDVPDDIFVYICTLLAEGFTPTETGNYLVLRAIGPKIAKRVPTEQIAWCANQLNFIAEPPETPCRPSVLHRVKAVDAELHGFTFANYLTCENCYQGYIRNPQNMAAVDELLFRLYPDYNQVHPVPETDRLRSAARYIVLQWWTSLKRLLMNYFGYLFQSSPGSTELPDMREQVNAQIRALTNGDITKQEQVLQADVWAALTELDAKAREAEEIKKQSSK